MWPEIAKVLTRRRLLELSGSGYLGLNLGGLWRAQAAEPEVPLTRPGKVRACILVFFYGGPSHLDTFDLKPNAPEQVRGEFKPIATSVPGVHVGEHLPRLARLQHKMAIIRSMHHANHLHDSASIEALTGRPPVTGDRELFNPTPQFFPSYGGALSYLWRQKGLEVPHAALPFVFHNVVDVPCQGAGFLGTAHDPFPIQVDPETGTYRAELLRPPERMGNSRLAERRQLLGVLDGLESGKDWPSSAPMRKFYDKAFRLLGAEAVRQALDLSRESPRTCDRYGMGTKAVAVGEGGGGGNGAEMGYARHLRGQNLLLARRLVEAGVPFVNVYDFKQQGQNWDAHFKVFNQLKTHLLPGADQGLSALIEDLDERGLLDSTLVVAMGEFGRTPLINKEGGRDHWPDCYSVVLAGGGIKGGLIHGSSDRMGAQPASDPVTPGDLAATIFWRLGIDPETEIRDPAGRPYRLADGQPLRSLFVGED
jgi:hypothetical protein